MLPRCPSFFNLSNTPPSEIVPMSSPRDAPCKSLYEELYNVCEGISCLAGVDFMALSPLLPKGATLPPRLPERKEYLFKNLSGEQFLEISKSCDTLHLVGCCCSDDIDAARWSLEKYQKIAGDIEEHHLKALPFGCQECSPKISVSDEPNMDTPDLLQGE